MWKQRINRTLASATGYELRRASPHKPSGSTITTSAPPRSGKGLQKTVVQGWDGYAGRRQGKSGVGDVWNKPKTIGIDVERAEDVVPYLDREVFTPFLGTCDVMLEIGPGGGRLTEVLLPKCRRLIAVDTSQAMLDLLGDRFADRAAVDCRLSDGRGLAGVADSSVDAAFSYGVFVHLQHWDIFNYLAELQRVLKPGGKALIQHSNTFSELGWAEFRREVPRQLNRHKRPSSFIVNSPQLMREFVVRAGLECVDTLTEIVRRDCITLMRNPE